MRFLLDTHTFLWYVVGSLSLSPTAKALIDNRANEAVLSLASVWEIAIKVSVGKLTLQQPLQQLLPTQLQLHSIKLLPIEVNHLLHVATLPLHHRDPFDRLLVAQSHLEQIPLISCDPAFDAYGIQRIW